MFLIGPLDKLFGSQIILINPAAAAQASACEADDSLSLSLSLSLGKPLANHYGFFLMLEDTEHNMGLYSTELLSHCLSKMNIKKLSS